MIELPPADTFDQSLALVGQAKDLRRAAEWARAGRRGPIHGASDIGQTNLADAIQGKLAAGLLPRDRPAKMWVGFGSGKACDACEQPITTREREYEFDPPGLGTIRLHAECLAMWHIERVKQALHGNGGAAA